MALHVLLNEQLRSGDDTRADDEEGGVQLVLREIVKDTPEKYELISGLDPTVTTYGADKQENGSARRL